MQPRPVLSSPPQAMLDPGGATDLFLSHGVQPRGTINLGGDMARLRHLRWGLLTAAVLCMGLGAQGAAGQVAKKDSGVRFASLRANDVNVRAGPGVRYPVKWKFVRRSMPVQIIAEYDTWRKIRDWEGAEGWVHRAMLSSKRSLILTGKMQTMRRDPQNDAPAVARLAPGMIVRITRCQRKWCEVDANGYEGWIRRIGVWGLYPDEKLR